MKLLENKNALIFGVANKRSIAWGIAKAFHEQGANVGISYAGESLERRVMPLVEQLGLSFVEKCDVAKDEEIESVAKKAQSNFGNIDILVHAIAFAEREELAGPYYNTSRAGFHTAMGISVYSFTKLAKEFLPILTPGGALLTITYHGSQKVSPGYNVMGVAKAALEASVRYLAYDLGESQIRVNAISAGPIRTLAAAGIAGFRSKQRNFADSTPLKAEITIEDVGNTAVYLCSDMSSKTTGEIVYVDSGHSIMGLGG